MVYVNVYEKVIKCIIVYKVVNNNKLAAKTIDFEAI
jgi:hypothetical protein